MTTETIVIITGCISLLVFGIGCFGIGYEAGWRAANSAELDRQIADVMRKTSAHIVGKKDTAK